jgi:cystathionine beta-lyase/cystathionine gamma-synthase
MGIDLAIQTATKYIGGHSDTLGGILAAHMHDKKIFDSEYLNVEAVFNPLMRGC